MEEKNIGKISTTKWNRLAARLEEGIEMEDKVYGFVMIQAEAGYEHEIYNKVKDHEHVDSIRHIFGGEYDFIAKVYGNTSDQLGEIIVDDIRTIPGITNTKTLPSTNLS